MPKLLIFSCGAKIIVGDTAVRLGPPWARRIVAEDVQDGKAVVYRERDVVLSKEIPQAEWDADIERQRKAQEEAQRRNPNPGDKPRLITPRR